jgi:hypothetical protein
MLRAACAGNILRMCTSTVKFPLSPSVPNSVHCRMISCSHALASCTVPSWMRLTMNCGDIFFFRTPRSWLSWTIVSCASRSIISKFVWRLVCLDAVSPCRGETSLFYVWCFTVNTVDALSNILKRDISTFVDVSRCSYMMFIRAFHSQLSRSFSGRLSLKLSIICRAS